MLDKLYEELNELLDRRFNSEIDDSELYELDERIYAVEKMIEEEARRMI